MTRGISPDIYQDEWFGQLHRDQRYLWIGLISRMADDQGRFIKNPLVILRTIFLYDEDLTATNIQDWIDEFIASGKLIDYESEGKKIIQIANWWKYQSSASWMAASKLPPPNGWIDRVRVHGKKREIISLNWDKSGGFQNNKGNGLGSGLGRDKDSNEEDVKEEVKEKEKEEEEVEENQPPVPAPAASFPFSESQTQPAQTDKATSSLKENPALQNQSSCNGYTNYKEIYKSVTGMATVPPFIDSQVKQIINGLMAEKKITGMQTAEYLQPFFDTWCTRKTKENQPYSKTSIGWLEWALSGEIPHNGNGANANKQYVCKPECKICGGAVYLRDPNLPVGHPNFGKIFRCDNAVIEEKTYA